LLESNNEGVKESAWKYAPDLIEAGLISKEEVAARKEGFLELLESNDEGVKWFARNIILPRLIEAGLISKEDLTSSPP